MTDSVYWIWLQLVFGVGTRRAEQVQEYFAHPREIYESIQSGTQKAAMLDEKELAASETAMRHAVEIKEKMRAYRCSVVTPDTPEYPPLLQAIPNRPAVLYCKGDIGCLRQTLAIAMVGARRPTEYGRNAADVLARGLAAAGAVVVSGLAVGVDAESHWAALKAGGKTVGVLGCGIDVDYPSQNRSLKTAVRKSGAVLTEFPPGVQPYPGNFLLRNRLISGMSCGTVVVQAGEHSGSLYTAQSAKQQGRELFAVPGDIFSTEYMGSNRLIQSGARLVSCTEDILAAYPEAKPRLSMEQAQTAGLATEPMRKPKQKQKQESAALPEGLSAAAAAVFRMLEQEARTADALAEQTRTDIGEILSALTELELFALVERRPGRLFRRTNR